MITSAKASPIDTPSCESKRMLRTSITGLRSTTPPTLSTNMNFLYCLWHSKISLISVSVRSTSPFTAFLSFPSPETRERTYIHTSPVPFRDNLYSGSGIIAPIASAIIDFFSCFACAFTLFTKAFFALALIFS